MKKAEKIPASERYETPAVAIVRDDWVHGHASGFDAKRRVSQPVRLLEGTMDKRREEKYVAKALKGVPRGTSVLNWPCGCSRLLPLLKKLGYHVTFADSSSHAVARVHLYGGVVGEDCVGDKDDFRVINIFQTGFEDDRFGAAIVNQLCCLPESRIRQLILRELRRICFGPIVVSFFCSTMIHEISHCERRISAEAGAQRSLCTSHRAFAEEVRRCGLIVDKWVPRFGLHTRQACVVLIRDKSYEDPSQVNRSHK